MSPFKRKAEIILHGVKLVIDAEDEARVIVEDWQIDRAPNVPVFYRNLGPIRNPYRELLSAFIVKAPFSGPYIEQIAPGTDYRKSNLRAYKPKGGR
jgi:hypothetical protein